MTLLNFFVLAIFLYINFTFQLQTVDLVGDFTKGTAVYAVIQLVVITTLVNLISKHKQAHDENREKDNS